MSKHMKRTTIRLDEELYQRLKLHAAASGQTVTRVIEDAIRFLLQNTQSVNEDDIPPELPVFAADGLQSGIDLSDNATLLERMES